MRGRRVALSHDDRDREYSHAICAYHYHAVFRNSPLATLAAESAHRGHAIVEQVIADLKNGPSRTCHQGASGPPASADLLAMAVRLAAAAARVTPRTTPRR
jgi:hypothetical protein